MGYQEQQEAFELLKSCLTKAPLFHFALHPSDWRQRGRLRSSLDAGDKRLRACGSVRQQTFKWVRKELFCHGKGVKATNSRLLQIIYHWSEYQIFYHCWKSIPSVSYVYITVYLFGTSYRRERIERIKPKVHAIRFMRPCVRRVYQKSRTSLVACDKQEGIK